MDIHWRNRLVSSEEMRELDRRTIEEFGLPGELLMESAGKGVFDYIERNYPFMEDAVIFCGKGNNGGDGFVVGRYLLNHNVEVSAILLGKKDEVKGDARLNLERFLKLKGELIEVEKENELEELLPRLDETDLIIDAIFGTGLNSEVKGLPRKAISLINFANEILGIPVIAVDLPSGIDASTGQVLGDAVRADATVTFGFAKIGHYTYPGEDYTGKLDIVEIGIPSEFAEKYKTFIFDQEIAFEMIKPRKPDAHKGDFGHTVIFAGSPGKTGAAVMTAESALRIGAGLVTLAVPQSLNPIFEVKTTEVMTLPLPDDSSQKFCKDSLASAKEFMADKDAIALGPGIGKGREVDQFVKEILVSARVPVVVDADGLNSLANQMHLLEKIQAPLILTPHPGEMSRLAGIKTEEIQKNRVGIARKFAQEWGVVLVLKGARTVTASPEGEVFINDSGNPGMASAGMGDVLTGIIVGLLSQKYAPIESAVLGVYIHGKAGDLAYEELGDVGIIAQDLIKKIPAVRKWLYDKYFGLNQ